MGLGRTVHNKRRGIVAATAMPALGLGVPHESGAHPGLEEGKTFVHYGNI